jgi:hypothetical protein
MQQITDQMKILNDELKILTQTCKNLKMYYDDGIIELDAYVAKSNKLRYNVGKIIHHFDILETRSHLLIAKN